MSCHWFPGEGEVADEDKSAEKKDEVLGELGTPLPLPLTFVHGGEEAIIPVPSSSSPTNFVEIETEVGNNVSLPPALTQGTGTWTRRTLLLQEEDEHNEAIVMIVDVFDHDASGGEIVNYGQTSNVKDHPVSVELVTGTGGEQQQSCNLDPDPRRQTEFHFCKDCGRQFASRNTLSRHIRQLHTKAVKKHECEICKMKFFFLYELRRHARTHIGNIAELMKCTKCGAGFNQAIGLYHHYRLMHEKYNLLPPATRDNNINVSIIQNDPIKYKCSVCRSIFRSKHIIANHQFCDKKKEEKLTCKTCGKVYSEKRILKRHMTSHKERFHCETCKMPFMDRISLKQHIVCHTGANLVKCSECDAGFNNRLALLVHLRFHKEKDGCQTFKCRNCGEESSIETYFCDHLFSHTAEPDSSSTPKNSGSDNSVDVANLVSLKTPESGNQIIMDDHITLIHDQPSLLLDSDGSRLPSSPQLPPRQNSAEFRDDNETEVGSNASPTSTRDQDQDTRRTFSLKRRQEDDIEGKKKRMKKTRTTYRDRDPSGGVEMINPGQTSNIKDDPVSSSTGDQQPKKPQSYKSRPRPVVCAVCRRQFSRGDNLLRHIRRVHSKMEKKYECEVCKMKFFSPTEYQKHFMTHIEQTTNHNHFHCWCCAGNPEELMKCTDCGAGFNRAGALHHHYRLMHNQNLNDNDNSPATGTCNNSNSMKDICKDSELSFGSNPQIPHHQLCSKKKLREGGKEEEGFICKICGKVFRYKKGLVRHIALHEERVVCETCKMPFTCSKSLQKHINCHTGDTLAKCSECEAAFNNRRALIFHLRFHKEKDGCRSFKCRKCGEECSNEIYFSRHLFSHTAKPESLPNYEYTGSYTSADVTTSTPATWTLWKSGHQDITYDPISIIQVPDNVTIATTIAPPFLHLDSGRPRFSSLPPQPSSPGMCNDIEVAEVNVLSHATFLSSYLKVVEPHPMEVSEWAQEDLLSPLSSSDTGGNESEGDYVVSKLQLQEMMMPKLQTPVPERLEHATVFGVALPMPIETNEVCITDRNLEHEFQSILEMLNSPGEMEKTACGNEGGSTCRSSFNSLLQLD